MTNGEKIQSIFPNMNFGTFAQDDVIVNRDYSNNDEPQVFIPKSVWNAEYTEPIPNNNLSVDCVSREEVERLTRIYLKEPTDNHVAFYEELLDLPSVIPIRHNI